MLSALVLALSGCPQAAPGATDAAADATAAADIAADGQLGELAEPDTAPEAGPSTLDFPVAAEGPFRAGYRVWNHSYTPIGATDGERTIAVHVWYPTEDTDGPTPMYVGLFPDEASFVDAALAPPVDGTSYPVHVHSHGHQGFAATSADLMRYFASHGWLAVSVDHTGDMLTDASDAATVAHYLKRPQDISQALDAVAAEPAFAAADTSRVLVSGHSRGTYTVWSLLGATYDTATIAVERPDVMTDELATFDLGFRDDRVVAGLPLAGTYRSGWFGDTGFTSVAGPMLVLTGSEDNPQSGETQWALLGDEGLGAHDFGWVELEGGCHQTFALGTCNTLGTEEGFAIVNTYALAFARLHVLSDGEMTPLLTTPDAVSTKATVMWK